MRWALLVALVLGACGGSEYVARPTFTLVLPDGEEQWKRDMAAGFQKTLAAYGYDSKVIRYDSFSPNSIREAATKAPRSKRAPVCIVFTRREQVAPVVEDLTKEKFDVITVGVDDSTVRRVAHVGISAERTVYLWKIRVSQMGRVPKRVLLVFGSEPAKIERIVGSFFARSNQGREFTTRHKDVINITTSDIEWAEMVVPFGEDSFLRVKDLGARNIFPISGADTILDAIERGEIERAITDDPFQVGLRTAQKARDFHLEALRLPVNNLEPGEADREYLRRYRDKRYELPWTVPQGK